MSENSVTVVGNLTDDPELRFTAQGAAVANFRMAVSKRIRDAQTNEWKDGDTSFFRVNVWRQLAENVAESLTRGMRVAWTFEPAPDGALRVGIRHEFERR